MSSSLQRVNDFTYKLHPDSLKYIHNSSVKKIFCSFQKSGFEIRVIGGAVRDVLLEKYPSDVDFATNAVPSEIKSICEKCGIKCFETGIKHGTLTAVINQTNYEITTLRTDTETDGRHAVVKFVNDWRLDAERRDLTINAMSLTYDGILFDYFGGVKDLFENKIRFVNDPKTRITEDYLRILRFFRFYGKIAKSPASPSMFDSHTLEALKYLGPNLKNISVERIWVEIKKILIGPFAPSIINLMSDLEILNACGITNLSSLHFNRFTKCYTFATDRTFEDHLPTIQSCALFSCFFDDIETANEVCKMLRLSNAEKDTCLFIIRHRSDPPCSFKHYQHLLARTYTVDRTIKFKLWVVQLMLCEGSSNEDISKFLSWDVPGFQIKGNDISGFYRKGELKNCLSFLKEAWIESDFQLKKNDLLMLLRR